MEVEDVDVGRAQFLQRRLDGQVHRLEVVARIVHFLLNFARRPLEVCRVLSANKTVLSL